MSHAPEPPADEPALQSAGEVLTSARPVLTSRPILALGCLLGLALVMETSPRLQRWRLLHPTQAAERALAPAAPAVMNVGEAQLKEDSTGQSPLEGSSARRASGPIAASSDDGPLPEVDAKAPPIPLENPSGKALTGLFAALRHTSRKEPGALTRIVHFGDSVVASDYVTSTLRRRLQEAYGDAGHGFTLPANAWPAYFHEGVSRYATSGWLMSRVVGPLATDGWHGLGGVSFKQPLFTLTRIGTAKKGSVGRSVSRFTLAYVASPGAGRLRVRIDGNEQPALDTDEPIKAFRTQQWTVPDGEHELELMTNRGTARLFGVVLERETPGVVLDAIGIQGARIRFLDKQDDAHWAEQLRWRAPAMVVYQFGANESADGLAYSMADYHQTMKEVIAQQRAAIPDASCLVVGAMDRAERKDDQLRSMWIIPLLVREQRAVAAELGCAFFDTYRAMGGEGAMPRWVRRGLGQADLTHPTAIGSEILGNWLFRALVQAEKTERH